MIMSSRQFLFLQINKIYNYTDKLFIAFCQYKMSLFKFIGFILFFIHLHWGSVQIPFFHFEISQTESTARVIIFTVTFLSLMYILPKLLEKIFSKFLSFESALNNQALQAESSLLKGCIYCTPINRASIIKIQFNEGLGNFPPPTIPELWNIFQNQLCCFFGKINIQM